MREYRINEQIEANEVRVVNNSDEHIGIMTIDKALETAFSSDLDLVEIVPDAEPPVVKIIDFGKFRFEQLKSEKQAKKKQREHTIKVKEIWLRPSTDHHDVEIKINKAKSFLDNGNRVKIGIQYRGRELSNINDGLEVLNNLVSGLDFSVVQKATKQGKAVTMVIGPSGEK